jgi:hypothetical protein
MGQPSVAGPNVPKGRKFLRATFKRMLSTKFFFFTWFSYRTGGREASA